jgi:hypothetical protein
MDTANTSPITAVVAKDEGDFFFIVTLREGERFGELVPFDPNRVRAYGSLADAQALADEHGVPLELT